MKAVGLFILRADVLSARVLGALGRRLQTGQVRFPSKFVAVERLAQKYCAARDLLDVARQTGKVSQAQIDSEREARKLFVKVCLESLQDSYLTFEDDNQEGVLPLSIPLHI